MTITNDTALPAREALARTPDSSAAQPPLLPRGDGNSMRERVAELHAMWQRVLDGPSTRATEQQHARGKLTARERLALLLDEDSFVEMESYRRHRATEFGMQDRRPPTDGVVTGWGSVHGRAVFVYAHNFRIFGGSLGEAHAEKIHKIMDMAESAGVPLISLNDGAGARIQEGVTALAGYGGIFCHHVRASGVIPQISVILGPCAGGATYSPALTDFVFMVRGTAQMFISDPDVVEAVTGERVSHDELGGAYVHATTSGVSTFVYNDEDSCLADVRYLVSLLPWNNQELLSVAPTSDPIDRPVERLLDLVPADSPFGWHGPAGTQASPAWLSTPTRTGTLRTYGSPTKHSRWVEPRRPRATCHRSGAGGCAAGGSRRDSPGLWVLVGERRVRPGCHQRRSDLDRSAQTFLKEDK